jgi:2Fe-2S ferredoxin
VRIKVVDRGGQAHVLDAEEGQLMMQALNRSDLVEATCGGVLSCATCQVYVAEHWLPQLPRPCAEETALLEELLNNRPGSRLACQIGLHAGLDGIEVTVAPDQASTPPQEHCQ